MSETITQENSVRETQALPPLPQRPGCGLWFWWVLATAVGVFPGSVVTVFMDPGWAIRQRMEGTLGDIAMGGGYFLALMVVWAVLGFAQWLVLRRYIQKMTRWEWVAATALGGATMIFGPTFLLGAGVVLAIVAPIGFAQWLVLRRYMQKAGAGGCSPTAWLGP